MVKRGWANGDTEDPSSFKDIIGGLRLQEARQSLLKFDPTLVHLQSTIREKSAACRAAYSTFMAALNALNTANHEEKDANIYLRIAAEQIGIKLPAESDDRRCYSSYQISRIDLLAPCMHEPQCYRN